MICALNRTRISSVDSLMRHAVVLYTLQTDDSFSLFTQ